jgi:hypothetical protein
MDYILQNDLWASEINVDLIINIKICGVCLCVFMYLFFGDMGQSYDSQPTESVI